MVLEMTKKADMVQNITSVAPENIFAGSSLFGDYGVNHQSASSSVSVDAELQSYYDFPPTACNPGKFWNDNRKQYERLYKVSRQMFCAPARQAPVERPFSISGYILSQRRFRTSDKNFENILFANVNFEVFDAELHKRKQPERDDDDE